MDSEKYFKLIIKNIKKVNNKYNEEHSFKPLVRLKKKNNNENNYNLTMESNLLKNRCKKMNKINKIKSSSTAIKSEIETEFNLFTTELNVKDNNDEVEKKWKELTEIEKLEKITLYFNSNTHINISDEMKNEVIELVKNDKINYKKYLIYDTVNQRIENLPIIRFDNETTEYKLLTDIEKKRKHSHKKKLSKIIKI